MDMCNHCNQRNHCNHRNNCNHCDCFDCCCEGPTGPQGPTGIAGPTGLQGPTGLAGPTGPPATVDCCCQSGLFQALDALDKANATVQITTFNQTIPPNNGTINSLNNDVVQVDDEFISICNIQYITYSGTLTIPECPDVPFCCCNKGIHDVLNNITIPANGTIDIRIADNNNSPLKVSKIDKLCNDVVWVQLQGSGTGNSPAVISLCSIFSISQTDSSNILPTIEQRVTNLEDTVDELDQRVTKIEKNK